MSDPGRLNTRLQLLAPSESDDGEGGVVRADVAIGAVWAWVTPGAMLAAPEADAEGSAMRARIVIRRGPALSLRHRFICGDKVYRITGFRDSADRRFTEIDALLRVT